MRGRRQSLEGFVVCVAMALIVGTLGCQSINSELATIFSDAPSSNAGAKPRQTPDGPKYQVEFRADGKQPQLVELPLPEVLYIQQALEQSGALKRFRRMDIELYRHLPGGGGHRLDIPFDRAKRTIPPAGDYAIHANDRIVVTEDNSTIVDDMMGSLGGRIGK